MTEQNPLQELIGHFNDDILALPGEGLSYRLPERRGAPSSRAFAVDTGVNFKYLPAFMRDLSRTVAEIPDTPADVDNDDYGYAFPDPAYFRAFLAQYGPLDQSYSSNAHDYVNSSAQQAKAWLLDFLSAINGATSIDGRKRRQIRFITGKVGSGKTTFLTYLSRRYNACKIPREDTPDADLVLGQHGVIWIPVQFETIEQWLREHAEHHHEHDNLVSALENMILVHLVAHTMVSVQTRQLYNSQQFAQSYLERILTLCFPGDAARRQSHKAHFLALVHTAQSDHNPMPAVVSGIAHMDREMLAGLARYCVGELGNSFLLVIDGFDNLSVDEVQAKQYSEVFSAFKEVVFSATSFATIGIDNVHFLVTLRNCTYEEFLEGGYIADRGYPSSPLKKSI